MHIARLQQSKDSFRTLPRQNKTNIQPELNLMKNSEKIPAHFSDSKECFWNFWEFSVGSESEICEVFFLVTRNFLVVVLAAACLRQEFKSNSNQSVSREIWLSFNHQFNRADLNSIRALIISQSQNFNISI